MIGAIAFSLGAVIVSSHFGLPYLTMIAPNPSISGYIGFYAGIIALAIIPLIALIRLAMETVWGYTRSYRFQTAVTGVWVVSFIIFVLTCVFTARNFVHETSIKKTISEVLLDQNQPLMIKVNEPRHYDRMRISFGSTYLTQGSLYNRDGIDLRFVPASSDQLKVTKSSSSRGMNESSAEYNIKYPDHQFSLEGNDLDIDGFYKIRRKGKFRDQYISYNVAVPIGTQLIVNQPSRIFRNRELRRRSVSDNQLWVMTKDGLEKVEVDEAVGSIEVIETQGAVDTLQERLGE